MVVSQHALLAIYQSIIGILIIIYMLISCGKKRKVKAQESIIERTVSTAQLKQTSKSKRGEMMKESANPKKIFTPNELADTRKTMHTTVTSTTTTDMIAEKLGNMTSTTTNEPSAESKEATTQKTENMGVAEAKTSLTGKSHENEVLLGKSKSEESLKMKLTQKTSRVECETTDINETQRTLNAQQSLADSTTQKDAEHVQNTDETADTEKSAV